MKPLIFIAGGSKGLGKALCEEFHAAAWDVMELSRSGQGKQHVDCDFSDVESANKTFRTLFEQHKDEHRPKINLIINAASLSPFGGIGKANSHDIQQHIDINISSAIMLIHHFSQAFQQHQAEKCMAYISSGAARRDIEGLSLYCASKAALERLVLTFNLEQQRQPQPINSMVINPGVMDTGMQQHIRQQNKADFPLVDHWTSLHSNGQLAEVHHVAKICHQLMAKPNPEQAYHVAQEHI